MKATTPGKKPPRKHSPQKDPIRTSQDEAPPLTRTAPNATESIHGKPFPIIGIGASAGGLEALEQFLIHVPPKCGMAIIIVQHMDPTHKAMMVELLQRVTPMPIAQVTDGAVVKPDHVYIIPPDHEMSILHGVLHLLDPIAPRGLRLPIDRFFQSLADDQQQQSIGVILSGMGSDGTVGIRSIKEKGGMVFVQDPASAKFDGMPRSAIESGLADIIAPIEVLPGKIVHHLHCPTFVAEKKMVPSDNTQGALEKVVILIRAQTGHDFSLYKISTLYRRVERRMSLHQIVRIPHYVRFLQENPQEIELLFKELLIGVTGFFRDPAVWDHLHKEILPDLLARRTPGTPIRAWIPGCSTGEEAYTLAIILKELLVQEGVTENPPLQIFATDLNREAIDTARQGVYPATIEAHISQERLERFFIKVDHGYQIAKPIREVVTFAPQNVTMDPPFTKLDILSCRNLLIYFAPEMQKKLLPIFHYSLKPSGVLVLGSAETTGGFDTLFAALDNTLKLYKRRERSASTSYIDFPSSFVSHPPFHQEDSIPLTSHANLQAITERMILHRHAPAAVLVNEQGDLLYISGKTGKYLEPASGKATLNIFAMAREGLRAELPDAIRKAFARQEEVAVRNMSVGTNGGVQVVDLIIQPVADATQRGTMALIVFMDVHPVTLGPTKPAHAKTKLHNSARTMALESENQRLMQELNSHREQMQASQEEMKSTNEELQSTNEELQSTNEELTTSKEEMHSLNEELQTVNAELQSKVDQLSQTSMDMKNLLNSTDIATVFLDNQLKVRRYTEQATTIFNLIPSDVGRPLSDLDSDLNYTGLFDDSKEVLRTLVFSEKEITTRTDRWFKIRILPYRTYKNVIDGVVMTFFDITTAKLLESQLREKTDGTLPRDTDNLS